MDDGAEAGPAVRVVPGGLNPDLPGRPKYAQKRKATDRRSGLLQRHVQIARAKLARLPTLDWSATQGPCHACASVPAPTPRPPLHRGVTRRVVRVVELAVRARAGTAGPGPLRAPGAAVPLPARGVRVSMYRRTHLSTKLRWGADHA